MAGELFKAMTGTNIVHVPHRNSGEARASVLGGQVEIMIDAVPAMAQNIAAGQVKALATTGKKRSTVLPDVPTVDEAGVKGYEATIWLGLVAPVGTPKQVVDKLAAEMKGVVGKPENVKMWASQGALPVSMTPAEFDKFLRDDIVKWAGVVKLINESAKK
jgi:tripartite-type tricarboxylate transporter receptor subunit TctC